MTTTMTKPFEQLLGEVRDRTIAERRIDRRSALNKFMFGLRDGSGLLAPMEADGPSGIALPRMITMSDLATKQLCQRTGYPTKLIGVLPDNLVSLSMNHLMQNALDDRNAMLRLLDGGTNLRAVLGSRYQPFDDVDLLDLAAPYLEGANIAYEGFGERYTVISAVWPQETADDYGLGIARGVQLANSEVGARSLTISSIVFRPACSNILPAVKFSAGGNIGRDRNGQIVVRARGATSSGAHDFSGSVQRADPDSGGESWRITHTGDQSKLEDFVRDAMDDVSRSYETSIAKWRQGLDQTVESMPDFFEMVAKSERLTQEQLRATLNAWGNEDAFPANSVTAAANAFTAAAQVQETVEDRYWMEVVGARTFGYGDVIAIKGA